MTHKPQADTLATCPDGHTGVPRPTNGMPQPCSNSYCTYYRQMQTPQANKTMDDKCLLCHETRACIRADQLICGVQGYDIDDFSEYYNGKHHFVMTKKLKKDLENWSEQYE